MFFDDAKTVSLELDLVLTGRSAGVEEKVPMCGVPHHAANSYIQRLIQKGYKVAIVEQVEDPGACQRSGPTGSDPHCYAGNDHG